LVQFHFHHPGEHRIDDKGFRMEAHSFIAMLPVHSASSAVDGGWQVESGVRQSGCDHAAGRRPAVKADPGIDPNGLLPAKFGYYLYSGSLTTAALQ